MTSFTGYSEFVSGGKKEAAGIGKRNSVLFLVRLTVMFKAENDGGQTSKKGLGTAADCT